MKTLLAFQESLLHNTISSPWKPIRPFLAPSTTRENPSSPQKTWKITADSKGFNGISADSGKRKMSKYKESDEDKGEEGDEKISDVVMARMTWRILASVGVPVLIGLAMLEGFSVVKESNLWEVPRWLPYLTTFFAFGASALGIAYGALSTNWDEEGKGSILGFEEFQKNWFEMWKETDDESE